MDLLTLFIILIAFELFESTWQKSDTLHGLIYNNHAIYRKSVFLYFIFHPTFIYTIFIALYLNNFTFWMSSIFIIKFLDISFKLSMMKKLSMGNDLNEVISFNIKMTPLFRYMNVIMYPGSLFFALNLI